MVSVEGYSLKLVVNVWSIAFYLFVVCLFLLNNFFNCLYFWFCSCNNVFNQCRYLSEGYYVRR